MDRPGTAARPLRVTARLTVALAVAGATALGGAPGTASAAPLQTVVVTGAGDVAAAVRSVGGKVLDRLPLIGGVSARVPADAQLPAPFRVVPNRAVQVAGEHAAGGPASTVRGTLGLGAPAGEGAGVTVAVVDTGVSDVPDLAGRLTHVDVTGEGTGDGYGHGTFVAGLVAGDGSASGGAYAGVAPGADVLDVRVARADGSSDLVTVLAGLQAVADRPEVDVVNLSLSSGSPLPYQLDPLTLALETLWSRGMTVVVPSGNDGAEGRGSVTSPGIDPVLLTVGGLEESGTADRADDAVAPWSGQGPAPQGVQKPDLVAPGSHVVSTAAVGSAVWDANPGSQVAGAYMKGSGSSFSTAVTSGAAAVLLAARDLEPDQVKRVLTRSAYELDASRQLAGSGGLDLAAALTTGAKGAQRNAAAFPGDPAWMDLVWALLDGDEETAEAAWKALSPEARQWAARQWAAGAWGARQWADIEWGEIAPDARQWAARQWSDEDWDARQWAARQWSARQWSARQWSARQWSARQWSARQWSEEEWSARQWSARQWSARQWTARQWTARQWTATDWA